jgi:hypothetical protein
VRQILGLGQAVGFFLLLVTGMPLLAMVIMAFVGYLPYSDRPGPGWYGLRLALSVRELRLFVDWWAFTAIAAMPAAAVLFVFHRALRAIRTPRWLSASVCGVASLFVSMYLLLAAGWYIALSLVFVVLAGLTGLVYGTLLLPRLPIPLADPSGAIRVSRIAAGGAAPILVVALVGLLLVTPRSGPEQAAALVVVGCSLDHERLTENTGALTSGEAEALRRLGVAGPLGVVAIITPWSAAGAVGAVQPLPIGEPPNSRPREGPRTVIVTPELPDAPLELGVAYTTGGLYLRQGTGWTTIPEARPANKRVRISPIRGAPGNFTVELEDVNMGSSFRYCR